MLKKVMSIVKKTAGTKAAKKTISKKSTTIKNEDILTNLKSEILDEVNPVLKKLSMPKIKKEVSKEFNLVLENEFDKMKNDFDSKHKKSHKNFSNVLEKFENKLLDGLKTNSNLQKQFETFKKTVSEDLQISIEGLISSKLSKAIESTIALHKKTDLEISDMKKSISDLVKSNKDFEKQSSVEIREEERKQAQFIVGKVNEVVDKVNLFEDEFMENQKKVFSNFELNVDNQFDQVEKKIRQELLHRIEIELQANHQDFSKKENDLESDLKTFKVELSNHVKNYIESLDKELKVLSDRESDLSLKEKDFMKKVKIQIGTDVSVLENKISDFKSEMDELFKKLDLEKEKKVFNKDIKDKIFKAEAQIKSDLDRQINVNNETLTRVELESKEKLKDLKDEVEEKLFSQINNFKESLDTELITFTKELDSRDLKINSEIKRLSEDRENFEKYTENLDEKLKNSNDKKFNVLKDEVEEKLLSQVDEFKKTLNTELNSFEKELDARDLMLDSEIKKLSLDREGLANERNNFNEKFSKLFIESKNQVKEAILSVKESNKDVKAGLFETVTKKLNVQIEKFNKKYDSNFLKFEKKVAKVEEKFEKSLNLVEFERESLEKEKESFEVRFSESVQATQLRIDSIFQKFEIENKDIETSLSNVVSAKLKEQVEEFDRQFETHIENFEQRLKVQEESLSGKVEAINNERKLLQNEREEIHSEIVELLSSSKREIARDMEKSGEVFDGLRAEVEEVLAKQVTICSDQLTKIKSESNDFKSDLKADVEDKVVFSIKKSEEEFNLSLQKFENELKLKEEEFLKKLLTLEDEKNGAITELSNFKSDLANHTKEYVDSLDEQLNKIKSEERNLEVERDVFIGELEETTKARKLDLETFGNSIRDSISDIIVLEKEKFESNESRFRDTFNEKVNNLFNFQKEKLESIEKKFIDKNLKFVENRVEQSLDMLKIVEDSIVSKVDTVNKKVDTISAREDDLTQSVISFEKRIENKIESGVLTLAKQEEQFVENFTSINDEFAGIIDNKFESLEKTFIGKVSKFETDSENRLLFISQREREFVEDLNDLSQNVNEKIEERVMSLEKSFNSRVIAIEDEADERIKAISQRERELVEDNLNLKNELNTKVEERLMFLESSFNTRILQIEEENKSKVDALSNRENELMDDFQKLEAELRDLTDEKIVNLEQSMNRKMLDINEEFTNFKGIVVDEVEDLMKEVKELMTNKVNQVDTHINRINFAGSEVVKRVRDFDLMKNSLEKEITFVRDDLNDLRVKQDVLPAPKPDSNSLVSNMHDYEQNLVNLISSLKSRGISDEDILNTLLQKGHPSFYVRMIINQL